MIDCRKAINDKVCKGDCCGCVPIKKDVAKYFERLAKRKVTEIIEFSKDEIIPITKSGICVFLSKYHMCSIYLDRPKVCKEYGVTKDVRLQCPHFKTNGNPRSVAQKKRFIRRMNHYQESFINSLKIKTFNQRQ